MPLCSAAEPPHPALQSALTPSTQECSLGWQLGSLQTLLLEEQRQQAGTLTQSLDHLGEKLTARIEGAQQSSSSTAEELKSRFGGLGETLRGRMENMQRESQDSWLLLASRLEEQETRAEERHSRVLRLLGTAPGAHTAGGGGRAPSPGLLGPVELRDVAEMQRSQGEQLESMREELRSMVQGVQRELQELRCDFSKTGELLNMQEALNCVHGTRYQALPQVAELPSVAYDDLENAEEERLRLHSPESENNECPEIVRGSHTPKSTITSGQQMGFTKSWAVNKMNKRHGGSKGPAATHHASRGKLCEEHGDGTRCPHGNRCNSTSTANNKQTENSGSTLEKGWKGEMQLNISALQQVQGWYKSRSRFTQEEVEPGGMHKFRPQLEAVSSALIVANLFFMGFEVEVRMHMAMDHQEDPSWLWGCDLIFAVAFTLELFLRAVMERCTFLTGQNWRWNVCDSVLVAVQIFDVSFKVINLSFLRGLRSLRALQAIRIIRTIRSVRELRLMIAAISAALSPLMWSFLLLILVLYLFSLTLQQTVQIYIEGERGQGLHPDLTVFYGSLGRTMVTLFMAISGGRDWNSLLLPLETISVGYVFFFMIYITFVLFGMLNILTAIFVESTKMIAEVDSELVIQEHLDRESSVINKVRQFLMNNANSKGFISRVDFENKLINPRFQAQLNMLDLDVHEAEGVFKIMNVHEDDEVNIEEFIYGLVRLKGNAKAVDVVTMLYESRRIAKRLSSFMNYTEASFQELRLDLGLPAEPLPDQRPLELPDSLEVEPFVFGDICQDVRREDTFEDKLRL